MNLFRQIEKLQKTVNHLLGFCTNSRDEDQSRQQPSNLKEIKQIRLGEMILKVQDGALEQRYILRLGKWLQCDPEALKYYVEFQNLCAMLYLHFNPNKTTWTKDHQGIHQ